MQATRVNPTPQQRQEEGKGEPERDPNDKKGNNSKKDSKRYEEYQKKRDRKDKAKRDQK